MTMVDKFASSHSLSADMQKVRGLAEDLVAIRATKKILRTGRWE